MAVYCKNHVKQKYILRTKQSSLMFNQVA